MSDPRELAQALLSQDDEAKEMEEKPPRFIELTEYKGVKYIARQVPITFFVTIGQNMTASTIFLDRLF